MITGQKIWTSWATVGGLGLGLNAAAGLFSLIGRHLVPGPYLDLVVTVLLVYGHAPAAARARLDKARAGGEILILAGAVHRGHLPPALHGD